MELSTTQAQITWWNAEGARGRLRERAGEDQQNDFQASWRLIGALSLFIGVATNDREAGGESNKPSKRSNGSTVPFISVEQQATEKEHQKLIKYVRDTWKVVTKRCSDFIEQEDSHGECEEHVKVYNKALW